MVHLLNAMSNLKGLEPWHRIQARGCFRDPAPPRCGTERRGFKSRVSCIRGLFKITVKDRYLWGMVKIVNSRVNSKMGRMVVFCGFYGSLSFLSQVFFGFSLC